MQTRFYPDQTLVNGIPIILGFGLLLMVGGGLLVTGPSIRQIVFLVVSGVLLLIVWLGLSRGTYVEISGKNLRVSRMFFRGRYISLSDAVSIHVRPIYAGFIGEIYLKVRKPDGTFREQGLINKPGMKESDMKKLIEMIRSANPNVKVDEDVFRSR